MSGGRGTVRPEPFALRLLHRIATQCSFGSQAGVFKLSFPSGQNLNCSVLLRHGARSLRGEMNQVSQPVLCVLQFSPVPQPFPIQIRVGFQDPRQSFDETGIEVAVQDGAENYFSRIACLRGPQVLKTGVAERRQPFLNFIRPGGLKCKSLGQRKRRRRELVQTGRFTRKSGAGCPQSGFEL